MPCSTIQRPSRCYTIVLKQSPSTFLDWQRSAQRIIDAKRTRIPRMIALIHRTVTPCLSTVWCLNNARACPDVVVTVRNRRQNAMQYDTKAFPLLYHRAQAIIVHLPKICHRCKADQNPKDDSDSLHSHSMSVHCWCLNNAHALSGCCHDCQNLKAECHAVQCKGLLAVVSSCSNHLSNPGEVSYCIHVRKIRPTLVPGWVRHLSNTCQDCG
jgi:hypothetical protein